MRFYVLISLFLAITCPVLAQQTAKPAFQSAQLVNDRLEVTNSTGKLLIQAYQPKIIKVTYLSPGEIFSDSSLVVVAKPAKTAVKFTERGAALVFATEALSLSIDKQSLQVKFSDEVRSKSLSTNLGQFNTATEKGLEFSLSPEEALYGAGSRAISVNRRGFLLENYHQPHYGYSFGEQNLNASVPLLISSKGYGIYFDNAGSGFIDLGKTQADQLRFSTQSGQLSYFLLSGTNDELLAAYTELTGRQPLPPRWALGFIQSRFGYKSATETLETVKKTKAAGYPIDATVLDLYWYGEVKTIGNHDWRRDSFPQPEKMLKDLKALGVKTIPITQTFVTRLSDNFEHASKNQLFTKDAQGKDYIIEDFWAGPAGLLDIFKPETQGYLWNFYRKRIQEGVDGWWCDLGEPEKHPDGMFHVNGTARNVHSTYPLIWSKTIYDGYRRDFPEQRVFNLARSGGAGMQRYATFPWSGDVFRSWSGFKAQIPIMLGMSMSGIGYMHSDAGGFAQGVKDAELYIRWMQFAAFTPIYRAHADPAVASPEPVFWDPATQDIVKNYIKMRYRFLPYTYSLAYQNTLSGRPLALPLNYFEPENTKISAVDDAYLWGKDLLIAPIIEQGQTSRKVKFPKGNWIDFWDGKTYVDSTEVKAGIDRLPIFARSGSFIILTTDLPNTEAYTGDTLMVRYFPDKVHQASFRLYEDDGKNPEAFQTKNYELLNFEGIPGKEHTITISGSSAKQRELFLEINQTTNTTRVYESKAALKKVNSVEELKQQPGTYWFDSGTDRLHIHYRYRTNKAKLVLKN
jgi:alpha-glucosidase (family GH31 glycosyl hydrolase)